MKNLLFTILYFIILIACGRTNDESDPQETLPPATQTGANTAGCLINGVVHIPKNPSQPIGGSPIYGLTAYATNSGLSYNINNYEKNIKLFIYIVDVSGGVGSYTIDQSNGIGTPAGNSDQNQMYLQYNGKEYLSSPNCGIFIFTKFAAPIRSATFSATLYNKANPSETIQITEGRFDINSATLNN